ncbi:hypothetical protein BD626DRAFT_506796 [Schizophyllum amplum]|uniref:Uncharacterized protein n=1 Tax=Schizophyllum amplum TaxID=97359 RepID=A0A550C515_9AGAR|nr:hypothetical protein BD626DRAFT_506796 [Auriculariopsis ampla]
MRVTRSQHSKKADINRLPVELLAEVFIVVALADSQSRDIEWIPKFSHVCSLWRTVALSTPKLWTNIGLYCDVRKWTSHLVQLRLDRSAPLPFRLSFTIDVERAKDIVRLLQSASRRWETLHIGLDANNPTLTGVAVPLPSLKTVSITFAPFIARTSSGPVFLDHDSPPIFSLAPNVVDLTFRLTDVNLATIDLPPAWKITRLKLDSYLAVMRTEPFAFNLVRQCRTTTATVALQSIELPELLTLRLDTTYSGALGQIIAPRLRHLTLVHTQITPHLTENIRRLLVHQGPLQSLQCLDLNGAHQTPGNLSDPLVDLLHAIPSLTDLRISNSDLGDSPYSQRLLVHWHNTVIDIPLLRALTCGDKLPPLLPNLTVLHVNFGDVWSKLPSDLMHAQASLVCDLFYDIWESRGLDCDVRVLQQLKTDMGIFWLRNASMSAFLHQQLGMRNYLLELGVDGQKYDFAPDHHSRTLSQASASLASRLRAGPGTKTG